MPEGDTVRRACAQLHAALAGQELVAAELRWPGLSTAALAGQTMIEVAPVGKHLLMRLGNAWTLHSHLRMDGSWRLVPTGTAQPTSPAIRAVLVTSAWTAVGWRLGRLDLVPTSAEAGLVGHLGPDILAAGFQPEQVAVRVRSAPGEIGAALLDQTRVAGIGTFWASEVLFLHGLNPWSPAAEVEPDRATAMLSRARRLMLAAVTSGVQATTGSRRRGETSYVHGRSGQPCRRCGTTVRLAPIGPPTGQRVLPYCPSCQGGLAPGDDGGSVAPLGSSPRRTGGYRRR